MRRVALVILVAVLSVSGCALIQKDLYHLGSAAAGLNRTVTLYAADGKVIRQWRGKIMVEVDGASASWIYEGRETKISGTFIVEQSE